MARKGLRFKPSLRDTRIANSRALAFMAMAAPIEKAATADAFVQTVIAAIPAAPKKRIPGPGVNIDSIHGTKRAPRQLEAPVVAAISQLLAVHPRVLWAARFNSGAASFEAASGRYAPVWFHRFVRQPDKMRMPDFFGLVLPNIPDHGRFGYIDTGVIPIAIEAKAPGWTKPRDDREREQTAFLRMIREANGIALFATSADQVAAALK